MRSAIAKIVDWYNHPRLHSGIEFLTPADVHSGWAPHRRREDAGAAAFAERFYRKLSSRSPPQAMAEAQREMLKDAKYHAPYYWAGYALSGTGELGLPASEV